MLKFAARIRQITPTFTVKRVLPFAKKRLVGPFIFLDEMGPVEVNPAQNIDVLAHPHIGLSTLTYLFEGREVHRDSLGSEVTISPGDVNWMTAGRGISHSEKGHPEDLGRARRMHGLQFWVALPDVDEDCAPSFQHYPKAGIPGIDDEEKTLRLVAGEAFGLRSPVVTSSPLVFADFRAKRDFGLRPGLPSFELGLYVVSGEVSVAGERVTTGEMLVLDSGAEIRARAGTHFVLIGGEPFTGPKEIWWNLVSSRAEKIEAAKKAWRERSFPMVPGETEYIPLPET